MRNIIVVVQAFCYVKLKLHQFQKPDTLGRCITKGKTAVAFINSKSYYLIS